MLVATDQKQRIGACSRRRYERGDRDKQTHRQTVMRERSSVRITPPKQSTIALCGISPQQPSGRLVQINNSAMRKKETALATRLNPDIPSHTGTHTNLLPDGSSCGAVLDVTARHVRGSVMASDLDAILPFAEEIGPRRDVHRTLPTAST